MTDKKNTIEELQNLPEPERSNKWARGALKRGFYSAVQAFHAANLAIIMLAPKTARVFGLSWATGGEDKLKERMAKWEQKIQANDIEPAKPSYLKSGASFALFNTGYIMPIIALGVAGTMVSGPLGALAITAVLNTHAMMGEAMVFASRRRLEDMKCPTKVKEGMASEDFRSAAKRSAAIRGVVCLAFTLAAGPAARALGGFTAGALQSFARTPIGGMVMERLSSVLTDQVVNAGHRSAVRSAHKPIGKAFAEVANNPRIIGTKLSSGYKSLCSRTGAAYAILRGKQPDPVPEQDNIPPEHRITMDTEAEDNLKTAVNDTKPPQPPGLG